MILCGCKNAGYFLHKKAEALISSAFET